MEVLGAAGSTVGVVSGSLQLIQFLWSKTRVADVIAALFDPYANRLEPSDYRLKVERFPYADRDDSFWWYTPVGVSEFELIPFATDPYTEPQFNRTNDGRVAWRWVRPPPLGYVWNAERVVPNVPTNFLVVGYKPSAIVRHFLSAAK